MSTKKGERKMGNSLKKIVETAAQEHLPPGGQLDFDKTREFISRLARVVFANSTPELSLLQDSKFWKDEGSRTAAALLPVNGVPVGRDLLTLVQSGNFSTLGAVGLMFTVLQQKRDVKATLNDTSFRSALNLYVALRIAQNELEVRFFNNLWMRDFGTTWRVSRLDKQFGQVIDYGASKDGESLGKAVAKTFVRDVDSVIGARGNKSVALALLEGIAQTELSGSQAELRGGRARFWKQRGAETLDFINAMAGARSELFDELKGFKFIKLDGGISTVITNNALAELEYTKYDTLSLLGAMFLKLEKLGDVKTALKDSHFVTALRLYIGLRAYEDEVMLLFLTSIQKSDVGLRFRTAKIESEYGDLLDMNKMMARWHDKGGVKY